MQTVVHAQWVVIVLFLVIALEADAQLNVNKDYAMVNAHVDRGGKLVVAPSASSSAQDFDFLIGSHVVRHRKLKKRLTNSADWGEFEGSHKQEVILKGMGNLEQHIMLDDAKGTAMEGIALRLFNPATKLWSIFWADSHTAVLGPPMVGSFTDRVGHFYSEDHWEGRPILIQFVWDARNAHEPQWSQAFSVDAGKTWEWNWHMSFKKASVSESVFAAREQERIGVVELRNYLLKAGKREQFIHYFEKELITPQAEKGGFVLGQYKIEHEPNRFCWIRGFSGMESRSAFLPAFYYGNAWKQHRNFVNPLIANYDHVHLLHPLNKQADTLVSGSIDSGLLNAYNRMAVVDLYTSNTKQAQLKDLFAKEYIPLLRSCGVTDFTIWESELLHNDFPKLPAFQDKNVLLTITFFNDAEDYKVKMKKVTARMDEKLRAAMLDAVTIKNTFVMKPTPATTHLNIPTAIPADDSFPLKAKGVRVNKDKTLNIKASPNSTQHDYQFLLGRHSIKHRKLKSRLRQSAEWIDLVGNKTTEVLLDGKANIERHYTTDNKGNAMEAIAFRIFNPKTKLWSLYWADSRNVVLDPPLVGSFDQNVGSFFGWDRFEGKEVLVQFQYDKTDPANPVWGQAFSTDSGKTWEWNWLMFFKKDTYHHRSN